MRSPAFPYQHWRAFKEEKSLAYSFLAPSSHFTLVLNHVRCRKKEENKSGAASTLHLFFASGDMLLSWAGGYIGVQCLLAPG